jgi:hypothetical protein
VHNFLCMKTFLGCTSTCSSSTAVSVSDLEPPQPIFLFSAAAAESVVCLNSVWVVLSSLENTVNFLSSMQRHLFISSTDAKRVFPSVFFSLSLSNLNFFEKPKKQSTHRKIYVSYPKRPIFLFTFT